MYFVLIIKCVNYKAIGTGKTYDKSDLPVFLSVAMAIRVLHGIKFFQQFLKSTAGKYWIKLA
jgi:hypothetical protein